LEVVQKQRQRGGDDPQAAVVIKGRRLGGQIEGLVPGSERVENGSEAKPLVAVAAKRHSGAASAFYTDLRVSCSASKIVVRPRSRGGGVIQPALYHNRAPGSYKLLKKLQWGERAR
jgi:hypothetical protein